MKIMWSSQRCRRAWPRNEERGVFRQTGAQYQQTYKEENVICSRNKKTCNISRAWLMEQGARSAVVASVTRG